MNFNDYIQRQKRLIRDRHKGEEFLMNEFESTPVRSSDEIFFELENMKGLNRSERLYEVKRARSSGDDIKRGITA